MARYRADNAGNAIILDTEKAKQTWKEATWWNGSNHISKATGKQWDHETLHVSSRGNYWIESTSNVQGTPFTGSCIDGKEAARWLLMNDHELPEDLKQFEESIVE